MDGHGSHITANVISFCIGTAIDLLILPPHASRMLQPLDVTVFALLKQALAAETDAASNWILAAHNLLSGSLPLLLFPFPLSCQVRGLLLGEVLVLGGSALATTHLTKLLGHHATRTRTIAIRVSIQHHTSTTAARQILQHLGLFPVGPDHIRLSLLGLLLRLQHETLARRDTISTRSAALPFKTEQLFDASNVDDHSDRARIDPFSQRARRPKQSRMSPRCTGKLGRDKCDASRNHSATSERRLSTPHCRNIAILTPVISIHGHHTSRD
ncbi:hypothetical protein LTS09_018107 [Friedmanniomyces endolithicus]|nr:hypothetical protein LTS09_018107 [Friedmanniomyces endolithicus]